MAILSRDEIEARIHKGEVLVIRHGHVLKLNSWVKRHPGGEKAILHMVGRDGTDEMDVYHSDETLAKMNVYSIGEIEGLWKGFVPPIQGGVFRSHQEIEQDRIEKREQSQVHPVSASDLNSGISKEHAAIIDGILSEELKFDLDKYPAVSLSVQEHIQTKFRELFKELEGQGYFQCDYWGYVREASRIITLFSLAAYLFTFRDQSLVLLSISALCLGLAWHQLTFIAHDSGHLAITHNYYIDNLAGIFVADFIGGLSLGWWKSNHNVHHIVTNDPVHDPDIQHLPFFAVSSRLFGNIRSSFYDAVLYYDAVAKVMLKIQHYMYYPILCFGRFNLYALSWMYLIRGLGPRKGKAAFLRWVELIGLSTFAYWYFYLLCYKSLNTASQRWLFILISHITTMPVHVQITLSHFAQSTSDMGVDESFAQRQVRTTMDVDCPPWFDYVHGGLQFQTIHHLFPRMPRHNFRKVQPRVIEFCNELGLHYTIFGFARGNKQIIGRLREVAEQAAIFGACEEFCRQEMIGGGDTPNLDKARDIVRKEKSATTAVNMPSQPIMVN